MLEVLFLHQIPCRRLNFIVLIIWTTRDQFLSWLFFKESTSWFMGVVVHTPTIGIPQILTWLFHTVPLRDFQGRISECNLFYSLVSSCSQNSQNSHNAASTLSSRWNTLHTQLKIPKTIKHELPQQPFQKSLTPSSSPLCGL